MQVMDCCKLWYFAFLGCTRRRRSALPKTSQPPLGRLHIGFVLPSLRGGGAERIALALAGTLMAQGHRIDLLMARPILSYPAEVPKGMRLYRPRLPNLSRAAARSCREQGIRVAGLAVAPTAAWDWFALGRRRLGVPVQFKCAIYAHAIARYVRLERPQLLLSLLPLANAAAIYAAQLLRHAIPVVASLHSVVPAASAWLPVERALYPQADALVACSMGVRRKMEETLGLARGRIRTICNPIPMRRCWRLAQEEADHPWFAAGEPPVVLTAGRAVPNKDPPLELLARGSNTRSFFSLLSCKITHRVSCCHRSMAFFLHHSFLCIVHTLQIVANKLPSPCQEKLCTVSS